MGLRVPKPLQKTFVIKVDGGEFKVTFRQGTVREDMARRDIIFDRREIRSADSPGEVVTVFPMRQGEIEAMDARMTLVNCDIEAPNGRVLLKGGMKEEAFLKAWGSLPPAWAEQILDCCYAVNSTWGSSTRTLEEDEGEAESEGQEESK